MMSPDGDSVVYRLGDGAGSEIFVADADGSSPLQLTDNSRDDGRPVWSPDGLSVLYVSGSNQLRIVNADGAGDRLVADNVTRYRPASGGAERAAAWSPDGSKIAYAGDTGRSDAELAIFVVNADGTSRLEINVLSYPWSGEVSWHPDGDRLAYAGGSVDDGQQIVVTDLDSNTHATLTSKGTGVANVAPQFSPDGMSIAFLHYDEHYWSGIHVMNADGTATAAVTDERNIPDTDDRHVWEFAWSPDSTQLVYVAQFDSGHYAVFIIDADGTDRRQMTDDGNFMGNVGWSPGGDELVFVVEPGSEIFTVMGDGTAQERLTSNLADESNPQWSPDGSKIVYVTGDGDAEIAVMDADGGNVTLLTSNAVDDTMPSWSPDGSKIVYVTGDGDAEIAVMDADGGNATLLTVNDYRDSTPAWSPQGTKIAYTSAPTPSDVEIYVMSTDGTGSVRLTDGGSTSSNPVWSPDGSKIAFTRQLLWVRSIHVMDADGSDETLLALGQYPTWSPYGTRIAFGPDSLRAIEADDRVGDTAATLASNGGGTPDWSAVAVPFG